MSPVKSRHAALGCLRKYVYVVQEQFRKKLKLLDPIFRGEAFILIDRPPNRRERGVPLTGVRRFTMAVGLHHESNNGVPNGSLGEQEVQRGQRRQIVCLQNWSCVSHTVEQPLV